MLRAVETFAVAAVGREVVELRKARRSPRVMLITQQFTCRPRTKATFRIPPNDATGLVWCIS
jgi:hypothetical protein